MPSILNFFAQPTSPAAESNGATTTKQVALKDHSNVDHHDPKGVYPLCCRFHSLNSRKSQQSLRALADQ
ncbi:hypothetical protein HDU98_005926 [Podochytrium sp. JEL0797]|nr:hypothetical protein HDU98_005926 [Podochytrium sp. JEL0797]